MTQSLTRGNSHGSPTRRFLSPVETLRRELDQIFGPFMPSPWSMPVATGTGAGLWQPALDITESDSELTIRAEVPGVEPENLKITVADNRLTISGEKNESVEDRGKDYYHSERIFGSFRRVIELPATANVDKVVADATDGLVTIRVPKRESAKSKQIPVGTSKSSRRTSREVPVGAS